jgi:hypothetical protein
LYANTLIDALTYQWHNLNIAQGLLIFHRPGASPQRAVTARRFPCIGTCVYVRMSVRACVCAAATVASARAHAYVYACMCTSVHVFTCVACICAFLCVDVRGCASVNNACVCMRVCSHVLETYWMGSRLRMCIRFEG